MSDFTTVKIHLLSGEVLGLRAEYEKALRAIARFDAMTSDCFSLEGGESAVSVRRDVVAYIVADRGIPSSSCDSGSSISSPSD